MELPKISIIIPVYNVEPYIEACINSVLSQTYRGPLECILVDDCSQDKSLTIAESIINVYTGSIKFKVIRQNMNRGLSVARNTGLDQASGKFVFFLDSDDEITPQCIELLSNEVINEKCDVVIGNYEVIGNRKYSGIGKGPDSKFTGQAECARIFLNGDIYVMAWNKLILKDFLMRNKLYFKEGLIYEDILWTFYMSFCISSVILVREVTYKYRIRPNSITSSIDNNKFQHQLDIFMEKNEFISSKRLYSQFHELKSVMMLEMSGLIQLNLSMNFPLSNIDKIRKSIRFSQIGYPHIKFKSWIFAVVLRIAPLPLIPGLCKLKTAIRGRLARLNRYV